MAAVAATVVVLVVATPAGADEPGPDVSAADASAILETAEATVAPAAAEPGAAPAADATIALHDLAVAMPAMPPAKRSRARALLTLPTDGARVVQGPGENAGVVDIGDGLAAVFKIESIPAAVISRYG